MSNDTPSPNAPNTIFSTSSRGVWSMLAATLAAASIAGAESECFWRYWVLKVSLETPSGKMRGRLSETTGPTGAGSSCGREVTREKS